MSPRSSTIPGSHCSLCSVQQRNNTLRFSVLLQSWQSQRGKSPLLTGILHARHGGGTQLNDTNGCFAHFQGRHCQDGNLRSRKKSLWENKVSRRMWQPAQSSLKVKRNCRHLHSLVFWFIRTEETQHWLISSKIKDCKDWQSRSKEGSESVQWELETAKRNVKKNQRNCEQSLDKRNN